jgi:CheY-like chemotaxis protein
MIRILVVDDDENLRAAVCRMLRRPGLAVEEAADGRAAIRAYSSRPADLILCDLLMPGTNGLEVVRELTAEFPRVQVVAMSGGGLMKGTDLLMLAQRMGAAGALEKPFSESALLTVLHRLIPSFPGKSSSQK